MGDLVEFPLDEPSLIDLADALETATDKYAADINAEAVAHNAYLREYHLTMIDMRDKGKVAVTIIPKLAEAKAGEQLYDWNLAIAKRDASRAKCRELEARLSAHQTHARFVSGQS